MRRRETAAYGQAALYVCQCLRAYGMLRVRHVPYSGRGDGRDRDRQAYSRLRDPYPRQVRTSRPTRGSRRTGDTRSERGDGLSQPARDDSREICGDRRRESLPHRRPRTLERGWRHTVHGTHGRDGEAPRPAHRAWRDRGRGHAPRGRQAVCRRREVGGRQRPACRILFRKGWQGCHS